MTGTNAFNKVRTLLQRDLRPAYYTLYWDGKDDSGKTCEPDQMYCYQIKNGEQISYAERLYLFSELWPKPNEIMNARMN